MQHPKSRCGWSHPAASRLRGSKWSGRMLSAEQILAMFAMFFHSRIPVRTAMVRVVGVVSGASWVLICGTSLIDGSDVIIGTDAGPDTKLQRNEQMARSTAVALIDGRKRLSRRRTEIETHTVRLRCQGCGSNCGWPVVRSPITTSDRWLAILSPYHSCTTHGFCASSYS